MSNLEPILGKKAQDFTRRDLMAAIKRLELTQLNLHYVAIDGKLKELKIPLHDLDYAEMILAQGERIDGSSAFKKVIDTEKSDLYIIPQYQTAFLCPFTPYTMGIMCSFLDYQGNPTSFAPENVLRRAHEQFRTQTGHELHALGELEFYLIYDRHDERFQGQSQRGYHQSAPFVRGSQVVNKMMKIISDMTNSVKYAHAEVGFIPFIVSDNPEIHGKCAEQFEIEFLLRPVEEMAMHLTLAKWIIRNVAHEHGMTVTFAPKIMEGMAGNGLHFHLGLMQNHINVMQKENGDLDDRALKMMAGLCEAAPSLTAFGNTVASSYRRLVINQEAPINICWSEQNRQALVRVPLGWRNMQKVAQKINPHDHDEYHPPKSMGNGCRQTVEFRGGDGMAHIHFLLAGLTVACREGLTDAEALTKAHSFHAERLGLGKDGKESGKFSLLPANCSESAKKLAEQRALYEKDGVFSPSVINYMIKQLLDEDDQALMTEIAKMKGHEREKALQKVLHKDLHKF